MEQQDAKHNALVADLQATSKKNIESLEATYKTKLADL